MGAHQGLARRLGALAVHPRRAAQGRQPGRDGGAGAAGCGEQLLAEHGFAGVRRQEIAFAWEFPDPETYARALASTGPAYEAIQAVGEEAFHAFAVERAAEHLREGLPLRAEIAVVGYVAHKPLVPGAATGFLAPPEGAEAEALFAEDLEDLGYVMNTSHAWGHHPAAQEQLFELMGVATETGGLSFRQRGVLVAATASSLGDFYCSLAWGGKLAGVAGDDVAAGVLAGTDAGLDAQERALAGWARQVVRSPNATTSHDVQDLRDAGFDERQILGITLYVALRLAFSTVNDALGVRPDAGLVETLPALVRRSVGSGRPPADA